eukprot:3746402-Prorocentrum_lima.AAC.1
MWDRKVHLTVEHRLKCLKATGGPLLPGFIAAAEQVRCPAGWRAYNVKPLPDGRVHSNRFCIGQAHCTVDEAPVKV